MEVRVLERESERWVEGNWTKWRGVEVEDANL